MTLRNDIIAAAKATFEAQLAVATANIRTYVENPVGVGEHPDITEVVIEEIKKADAALSCLETIEKLKSDH